MIMMMMMMMLPAVAAAHILTTEKDNEFLLPKSFIGMWEGTPEFSVFGPFSSSEYTFSISQSETGSYLMENNIVYDGISMGYQRFYVDNNDGGYLWYCGNLTNFADEPEITGSSRKNGFKPVVLPDETDSNVTFCLDSDKIAVMGRGNSNPFKDGCAGCDCANWTISYDSISDLLFSELSMAGSQHLKVALQRAGDPAQMTDDFPDRLICDFSDGGRDSVPVVMGNSNVVQCPFMKHRGTGTETLSKTESKSMNRSVSTDKTESLSIPVTKSEYDHCYRINKLTDFQLQWTLDTMAEELRVSVSASAEIFGDSSYIAVGFRPMSRYNDAELTAEGTGRHMDFGMEGADIVLGSWQGVSRLYAAVYYGAPVPDTSLDISAENAGVSSGRVFLSFTRPLVSGYLLAQYNQSASIVSPAADIIYAVGSADDTGAHYHGHTRGLRFMDWEHPELNLDDSWKC